MAFLAATQLTDDFVLATQPDLAVETDSDPEENVILPPQQVGVLVVDTEQRIGVEEYPLFLGCNIIGRDITDIPGADEVRQERLRQWRNENLEVHVEAIFVSEPSLSKTHAHIYLEDGGLNCFVTALRTTNPSFIVPAGAASRAHTLSPGVRYNVRPDDVLRFGRLYCRVLCGPDWLAREQQQRQVRLQPWHGNGEAEYLRQGLDGRLAAEHRRGGSPQHLQYRLNQDDPWQQQQQQEQQQQGFRSAWSLSPGAVQRPSGAAISHNAAGSTEGLQAGREEECIGGLVSGGAAAGPVAGSPVTAAGADAVEGHTSHGSAGAPGQPRQQRIVPPTQDVSVGPLLQLPDGRHHEAWMPAPGLQQHRHGPLPVPVMKVIALVPPQGAGAAGALSGPDTLIAAAGAVGSGPPQTYGAGQPPGAVLVQLHGGATALLPGDASAAMLPLQVQMPFPLLQAVSETEEEEENEEEKELEEEKRKDVSTGRNAGPDGVVPRAGTITPADPPAPWWEVADSLDDTHDGAWGASQSTDKPGEADAYPRSPGPGGGAEALHPGVGEEAGDRSLQHPSRPLRVKLEPTEDLGGPQSANGAHASSAENLDEHRHPHYVEGDDRSICDGDAIMCDLTQPPDEEVLGVPGDGFAIADDAEAHAHIRKHQENQQQLVYNRTDLGPSLPILGPSPPQEPHSDDETAPPSPSPPSLSDAPNRVGASADGENLGKTGPDGCRIMASGGGDVRSHFLERIDSTGRALAERVPQVAVPAGAIVPPTQLVDGTSLVLPSTHAVMPPPPQQHPACPSHSLQKDSHQSRFGQVVQPQCPQQQRRRSHPEGGEEADPAVWGVHGLLGEAAGGRELLPDAVGGCRRLLLGILSDLSPSSSPNPESGSKAEGKPVSTDHHQPPEDLQSDHIPPLQHPLQRLEDQQQQLQPPLRPQTAVAMEALAKPPSPTPPHCKNAGAPTPLAAATATVGAGVAATAGIPAAGTEPPGTGPPASFYISQSASPWDMDAARQRVGRLVSLLCSTESSGPSQEELWQPLQLPQPPQPMQLPPGRNGAEDVVNLDGAVQEGPEPRANAVGMVAPSGRSMPLGLANEQPPPAQPQQLLRQQPPEQMDARDVVLLPPRAAGEMQSLTGAAANAEFLQQARLPPPSPALLGSPTVSVRSFMIPGFGTQIAADALHQLMMAESAPTGNAETPPGQRLDAAAAVLRGARDNVPTDSAAEYGRGVNLGRELHLLGGACRGGRGGGGGRGRIGGAKAGDFGYSNADYVYEFPADAGDDGDEDYVQTPRRGRGRGRGARGGRGRGGRGSKGARGPGKPPTGPHRAAGTKRRASATPNKASPTGDATAAYAPPPRKRSRRGSREACPVPLGPEESHQQQPHPQQQQLCGELALGLQYQQQQQQQQHLQQQLLLLQLQQQRLTGGPHAVPQPAPTNGPKGRGRGRLPAGGHGHPKVAAAAAADLAPAGALPVVVERAPGRGTTAEVLAVAPEIGGLASPQLQWATRRRRTSASLSREGSVEQPQGSGSAGQPPLPSHPPPSPQPRHLPTLSLQGPSPPPPTQSPLRQLVPQHQTSPDLLQLQQHHLPLQQHDQGSLPRPPPPPPPQQQQQDDQEHPSALPLDDEMQYVHHDDGDDGGHIEALPNGRIESPPRRGSSTGIGSHGLTRGATVLSDAETAVAVGEPCTLGIPTATAASFPESIMQHEEKAPVQQGPPLRPWDEAPTARRLAVGGETGREPPHAPGTTSTAVGTTAAAAPASRPFKRPRVVAASRTAPAADAGTAAGMVPRSEPPSAATLEAPGTCAEHDKRELPSADIHTFPQPQGLLQPQALPELNRQQQQLSGLAEEQLQAQQPPQPLPMRTSVGGVGGGRGDGSRRRAGKRKAAAREEPEQEPVPEPRVEVKPAQPVERLAEGGPALIRSPGPSRVHLSNGAAAASPIGGVISAGPGVEQNTPHGAGGVRGTSVPEGRPPLAQRPPLEQQQQLEQHDGQQQQQQQRYSSCSPREAEGAAPKRRSSTGARKPRRGKARQVLATAAETEGTAAEEPDAVGPMGHDSSATASPQPSRHTGSSPGVTTGLRRRRVNSNNGAGGSQLPAAEDGAGGGLAPPNASTAVVVSISRNIPERERNGLATAVQRLGGRVAEDEEADAGGFTHLLLARHAFTTSMKVLAALAAGRPLLDAAWLDACRGAGRWLEPHLEHTAVDPKAEKQHKFKIWDAYQTARREGPMFQGRTFYATPLRSQEDAKKVPPGAGTGSGSKASKVSGRASIGGAGRSSGPATASPPTAAGSAGSGTGPAQGLALIAQLAGARLLVEAREVVAGETVVVGQPGELRWARQHLPSGTRVYDKDGFVQALLHQRLDGIKPAFVV